MITKEQAIQKRILELAYFGAKEKMKYWRQKYEAEPNALTEYFKENSMSEFDMVQDRLNKADAI